MKYQGLLAAATVLLIAGCTTPDARGGPGSSDGTLHDRDPGSDPIATNLPRLMDFLAGSECHGFATTFDAPASWYSDEVPPEWRYDGPSTRHYGFAGYECERLGLPDVERGPAALLIEFHANAEPPEACTGPGAASWRIVRGIYTNDEDVALALNATWGIQAELLDVHLATDSVGGGERARYEWAGEHGASDVEVIRVDRTRATVETGDIWLGLSSLGPWRLDFTRTFSLYDSTFVGIGTMSQETLHAKLYGNQWIGTTLNYKNVNFSAEMTRFTNLTCEEVP